MKLPWCFRDNDKVEDEKPAKNEIPGVSYFELYRFATNYDCLLVAVAIVGSLLGGTAYALFAHTFGEGVHAIIAYAYNPNNINQIERKSKLMEELTKFAIKTSVSATIVLITTYLATFLLNFTALNQICKIRKLYLSSILNQDVSWHDQHQVGDLLKTKADKLRKVQKGIGEKLGILVFKGCIILVCIVEALIKGWELTLVSAVPFPIFIAIVCYIGWLATRLSKKRPKIFEEARSIAKEALENIKTVVAYDGQEEEKMRYRKLLGVAMKKNIKRSVFKGIISGVMTFFMYASCCLVLWCGIKLVRKGRESYNGYTVACVVVILKALTIASLEISTLSPFLKIFSSAKEAAAKIYHVISSQPVINKSYGSGLTPKDLKGKITFEKVHFNYPKRREIEVLKGLSFSINPGKTVALVGSSGCGKSTCIQLLQRFYDPNSGNIYIDDTKLTELDLAWMRQQIGVVEQDPVIFEATIADNIRFGYLKATQAEIERAAYQANAHYFIEAFSKGYDTVIGEQETQLSACQKQRIVIARALLRKPMILILDEATSSLDLQNESVVQAALDCAAEKCTTIIVTNKVSTIRNVDNILVIQDGELVEEGSHDELMKAEGVYNHLVALDASKDYNKPKEVETTQTGLEQSVEKSNQAKETPEKFTVQSAAHIILKILKVNLSEKWITSIASIACICSISNGLSIPFYGFMLGTILSDLAETHNKTEINFKFLLFVISGVLFCIMGFLQTYLWGIVGEKFAMDLRHSMFGSMLSQEMSWFDKSENRVDCLTARLSEEVASVQGGLGQKLNYTLLTTSLIVATTAAGLYLQYKLLLVALICNVIFGMLVYYKIKVALVERNLYYKSLESSTKLAVGAINNIRTVASLGIERWLLDQYTNKMDAYFKVAKRNAHFKGIVYSFVKSSLLFFYVIYFFYGGTLLKNEEVTSKTILVITELLIITSYAILTCIVHLPNLAEGILTVKRIFRLIDRVPKTATKLQTMIEGDISYESVAFAYPTRLDVQVLKNLNMMVMKGSTVALTGRSGCGKSTIVQLLQRFYDPTSGKIVFGGGTDLGDINLFYLRIRIGVVTKEPSLFSRTIAENIAYGDHSRKLEKADIISAAQKANIHNFITSLPLGYHTMLGEKETQLSEGQKLRVALARALIRNPEILLLDEVTSSLDAENEKIVQEALDNATIGRTCIVITQNLEAIRKADVIMVINGGQVAETGNHEELMAAKNLYWELHHDQEK